MALPVCAVTVLGSLQPCFFLCKHLSSAAMEAGHCCLNSQTGAVRSAAVLSEGLELGFS